MTTLKGRPAALRFGNCEVRSVERQVLVAGQPVLIGSRAFDVLMSLIERPGRVVGRAELLDAAWPGLVVEENNLSVQIAALRKVLGPQVITTIPGLGYRFSAALDAEAPSTTTVSPPTPSARSGSVAPFQPELIGREADIADVVALLEDNRLVTISGAGGIGKTRLAWAVAVRLRERFAGGTWVVELATITPAKPVAADAEQVMVDARQVTAAISQALGLSLPGLRDPLDELAIELADAELLLVLDNCEHLVAGASHLVQLLAARTRQLRLLTTTQTPLRLSGFTMPCGRDAAERHVSAFFGSRDCYLSMQPSRPNRLYGGEFEVEAIAEMFVDTSAEHADDRRLAVELQLGRDLSLTRTDASAIVIPESISEAKWLRDWAAGPGAGVIVKTYQLRPLHTSGHYQAKLEEICADLV